jgi:hypothetical protein
MSEIRIGDSAPSPPAIQSESEVVRRWQGDKPVVSILCPTYQHVDFIEDALHGFLGQETSFPFEVIVRDDASTDGTAEIVRDYADRYPNIIRIVLEKNNRYPVVQPSRVLLPLVRGKYVIMCEGDDYWFRSNFLNRQVYVLEVNQAAVAVHADCLVVADRHVVSLSELARLGKNRNLSQADLLRTWYLPVRSLLYRSAASPREHHQRFLDQVVFWDNVVPKMLAEHGVSMFLQSETAVVRNMHSASLVGQQQMLDLQTRLIRAVVQHKASAQYSLRMRQYNALAYWLAMLGLKASGAMLARNRVLRAVATKSGVLRSGR